MLRAFWAARWARLRSQTPVHVRTARSIRALVSLRHPRLAQAVIRALVHLDEAWIAAHSRVVRPNCRDRLDQPGEGQREVVLQRLARFRIMTGQGERRDKDHMRIRVGLGRPLRCPKKFWLGFGLQRRLQVGGLGSAATHSFNAGLSNRSDKADFWRQANSGVFQDNRRHSRHSGCEREMGFTAQSRHDRAAGGVQRASFVARSVKHWQFFAKRRARINTRERNHLCVGPIRRPALHAANRSKSPDHRRAVHRFGL